MGDYPPYTDGTERECIHPQHAFSVQLLSHTAEVTIALFQTWSQKAWPAM